MKKEEKKKHMDDYASLLREAVDMIEAHCLLRDCNCETCELSDFCAKDKKAPSETENG